MTINGLRNQDTDFGNAWMNDHHCMSKSIFLVYGRVRRLRLMLPVTIIYI